MTYRSVREQAHADHVKYTKPWNLAIGFHYKSKHRKARVLRAIAKKP